MKTSNRFNNAVTKLYNAFHNNYLIPECANRCAVGNILNNTDNWINFSDRHGSKQLNYIGLVNEKFGKRFSGYKPSELLEIEYTFLKACGYKLPLNHKNKKPSISDDVLFEGLEAVVNKLCDLDNIPHVMDCSLLFDYEPKLALI